MSNKIDLKKYLGVGNLLCEPDRRSEYRDTYYDCNDVEIPFTTVFSLKNFNLEVPFDGLFCAICKGLLHNPYYKLSFKGNDLTVFPFCESCGLDGTIPAGPEFQKYGHMQAILNKLEFQCSYCSLDMALCQLQSHILEECQGRFYKKQCDICQEYVKKSLFLQHKRLCEWNSDDDFEKQFDDIEVVYNEDEKEKFFNRLENREVKNKWLFMVEKLEKRLEILNIQIQNDMMAKQKMLADNIAHLFEADGEHKKFVRIAEQRHENMYNELEKLGNDMEKCKRDSCSILQQVLNQYRNDEINVDDIYETMINNKYSLSVHDKKIKNLETTVGNFIFMKDNSEKVDSACSVESLKDILFKHKARMDEFEIKMNALSQKLDSQHLEMKELLSTMDKQQSEKYDALQGTMQSIETIAQLMKEDALTQIKQVEVQHTNDMTHLYNAVKVVQDMYATDNGIYTWIVKDIFEIVRLKQEFESALCRTSPDGYVYKWRLALKANVSDMSIVNLGLYVKIYKGPFDDVLAWPMNKKITVALKSCVPDETVKKQRIECDLKSNSFAKPNGIHNIPIGLATFLTHVDVANYAVNNTLYIVTRIE